MLKILLIALPIFAFSDQNQTIKVIEEELSPTALCKLDKSDLDQADFGSPDLNRTEWNNKAILFNKNCTKHLRKTFSLIKE